MAQQGVEDQVEGLEVLVCLAVGQLEQVDRAKALGQHGPQGLGVERRHGGVADDQRAGSRGNDTEAGGVFQQATADQDRVAALAELDLDAFGL
ncbi:hypothetical protein D9M69_638290 [compost metagenome]